MNLSWNVLKLRKRLGLTQKALSKISGVGENTIGKIEICSGEIYLHVVVRLADALGVRPGQLLEENLPGEQVGLFGRSK